MTDKLRQILFMVLRNLASKRTWVLIIASIALWDGLINSSEWMILATIYLGDKVAAGLIAQKTGAIGGDDVIQEP